MKSGLTHVLFLLFEICVFGDADIVVETVSVIEGDSVTLHTDVTEIRSSDVIEWRMLNGSRIARISGNDASTSRDRLQLDKQTGDITITNIKTTDSGEYKLKIKNSKGSPEKTFSVSVVSGVHEVKSVSVIVGDSVSLKSGTIIQRDDVIEWRFGDLNSLIAENNRKTGNFSTSDGPDGRFRDRLQLDYWTGSLTITHTSTNHSGLYEASIRKSSSLHTIHKSYSVTASGEITSALSVKKGYSVTLHTDLTEMQTDDFMQWMFGDTVLAEISKAHKRFLIHAGPDERFRDRLKLDHQTRSLIITDIRFTDSGDYKLKISSSRFIINKRITVTVIGEMTSALSVKKGYSVTLHTDLTEMQTYDLMQWMFEDTVLAEINKAGDSFSTSDGPAGRFRDRLKLDHQTRSLTITHTRFTDSGLYELKISSSRFIIKKRITVTVTGLSPGAVAGIVVVVLLACVAVAAAVAVAVAAAVIYHRHKISEVKEWGYRESIQSVMVGKSVTLKPDETDVHKDNKLLWMFRSSCIAVRKSAADGFTLHDDLPDKRFKDRLKPDPQTGSLTITHTTTEHTGLYELLIIRPGKTSIKRFSVSVFGVADCDTDVIKTESVKEGESVTLKTGVIEIQKDERIQWKFGYTLLAKITRGTKKISPLVDKMFKVRLELDHQTGSLTINKIRPTDAGMYILYKIEKENLKTKLFRIKVLESTDNRNKPEVESVRINNPEEVPLNSVL